ncbi:MAG: serine/threonine-protein kinase [Sandaracinaceae bacterium]
MQALRLGQFRFTRVRELGRGGLGQVIEIRVTESASFGMPEGSHWALKELNDKWRRHPEMVERFEREIIALQSMRHPNIITQVGENLPQAGRFYVMPVYQSNLRQWLVHNPRGARYSKVAGYGLALAEALLYAHRAGFIHRDLKPENVLFNPGEDLKIADWGLGYFVHQHSKVLTSLTRGGMGTEYYCSLEQWSTGKCDERGDIYSLGMTLDELATGRQRPIKPGYGISGPPSVRPSSNEAKRFNELLMSMTSAVPSLRPASMAEVSAELRWLSQ